MCIHNTRDEKCYCMTKKSNYSFSLDFKTMLFDGPRLLRELDRRENDFKDSLVQECNACVRG